MPIESEPYYFAVCDNCGERCDYGDYTAWQEAGQAADLAEEYDWTRDGDRFHCPQCPPLPAGETDCKCPTGDTCPCEEGGGSDGLCACCREGDHNGACAAPGRASQETSPAAAGTETTDA